MALLNYLNIPIRIVYLDSNLANVDPTSMVFPMDVQEDPSIVLLYRPGHYDILYKWTFTYHLLLYIIDPKDRVYIYLFIIFY